MIVIVIYDIFIVAVVDSVVDLFSTAATFVVLSL